MFWLGPLTAGTKGEGIIDAQDKCPIMNQHLGGIETVGS